MVDIRVAGWALRSDANGWIVSKPTTIKSGKNEGEEVFSDNTYHGNLRLGLAKLQDRVLRESDARSFGELREAFDAFWVELQEARSELEGVLRIVVVD